MSDDDKLSPSVCDILFVKLQKSILLKRKRARDKVLDKFKAGLGCLKISKTQIYS